MSAAHPSKTNTGSASSDRAGDSAGRTPPVDIRDPISPLRRALGVFGTWALLFVATPGMVTRDGLWWLATVALVPWGLVASRPGKRAFAIEWLAAAVGISASCFWSTYVIWLTLLAVALVPATYMALAGVVLRRVARAWPLAVAVPAAWIALETLRFVVEPPLGFGWLRLGHHAHGELWLAGSARVWGTAGIGFAMAAVSGGIADVIRARATGVALARPRLVLAAALGPLVATIALSFLTSAPATVDGPRVLLVQPAYAQERKMALQTADEMLQEALVLTQRGLDEARRANEPIDVVAWGETMMPYPFAAPDALEAWDRGVRPAPWGGFQFQRSHLVAMRDAEVAIVEEMLYGRGRRGILPPETSFVSGVEHFAPREGHLRRHNAVVAWDRAGRRAGVGGKVHLVPGAEHLAGLERIGWVRSTAKELAGYVPDVAAFDEAQVLVLEGRGGRSWRAATSVCFDNAFEGPYVRAVRAGAVDFHLVASNEAWYRTSWEYDHMMAFSHLLAIETGRSLVRATNAGVSCVVGPDGRDVARLEIAGRDRMVAGTLRALVPIPARAAVTGGGPEAGPDASSSARAPAPLYVATQEAWLVLWCGLGLVLSLFVRGRAVTARG